MKALIVEDDFKTAGYLQRGLTEQGFSVDLSHDGASALDLARGRDYDLYVFDVMLPFLSGIELLRQLRAAGKTTHAIFLTAKDQTQDKVLGLESGADAYIVKPFSFSEFVAVIRSLQRRKEMTFATPNLKANVIQIGDLELDRSTHSVVLRGTAIDLTPTEFRLLLLLARHPNEVISKTLILEQVWNINFECSTNVVEVHVRRLRSKIEEPSGQPLIQTIRGVGYMLKTSMHAK